MARSYSSALRNERAAANRRLVVQTADRLFRENGWVGTTMADVAKAAGLTRQTVYQQFDGKLSLLDACIVSALSDGADQPVRQLDDYRLMGVGSETERLIAGARWLRGAHERSADIQNVLDQAAVTDDAAAQRLRVREEQRHDEVAFALRLILGRDDLPEPLIDSVWMLASRRAWLMLTGSRGWTPDRWETWFTDQVSASVATFSG